jgi:hypothetical protein
MERGYHQLEWNYSLFLKRKLETSLRGLSKWDENVQHRDGYLIPLSWAPLKNTTGSFSFFLYAVPLQSLSVLSRTCFYLRVWVVIPSFNSEEKILPLFFMFSKSLFFWGFTKTEGSHPFEDEVIGVHRRLLAMATAQVSSSLPGTSSVPLQGHTSHGHISWFFAVK